MVMTHVHIKIKVKRLAGSVNRIETDGHDLSLYHLRQCDRFA